MDKLKAKRTVGRKAFTKTLNVIKEILDNSEIDVGKLKDGLVKIENIAQDIKVLDNSILDCLIDAQANEIDVNSEVDSAEKYSDEFITIKRRINEYVNKPVLKNSNSNDSEVSNYIPKMKHYKLPEINIKPFDGQLINYLAFWSQFKKIHDDNDLEDCDKFQYLLQSVQSGTRARELLESYPLTSENYSKAVAAFQERFGNKDMLIEVFVREFLKLIISNARANCKDRLPLPDLYMKVEAYLRSLESMGLDSETNSAWLFPMVESSLPEDVLKAWQRSSFSRNSSNENPNSGSNLSRLMKFLKREVEGEERLQLVRTGFETLKVKEVFQNKHKERKIDIKMHTAASLLSNKEINCIFCKNNKHQSKDCFAARGLSLEERTEKVRENNCCLKCLRPGHRAKHCRGFIKCHICAKSHVELLCPVLPLNKSNNSNMLHNVTKHECEKEVMLMTLEVVIMGNKPKRVRTLLDCGSQKSYILKNTAKELGLIPVSKENITQCLFGGTKLDTKPHEKFKIQLSVPGRHPKGIIEVECLDQDIICNNIPRVPKGPVLKTLKKSKIWLSDMGSGCPEIELLLGSDVYGKLLTGQVKQLTKDLTAIQTKLGWVVCGQLESPSLAFSNITKSILITNLVLRDMSVPELWKLETIGIREPSEKILKLEEDNFAYEHFVNELSRNREGRYCVALPWISVPEIPSNRHIAEKRLFSTTKKLKSMNQYSDYEKVFREWEKEGVIERVTDEELEGKCHYLPHHPVIKSDSLTTKIRPVFDASCKVGRAPSLNDYLVKGPNLIEQIPAVLLRFREKAIAVVADIRRAFLQIEIKERDRDYLRFLWWENSNKIKVFRHNRVVFGVTCSPFLLGAVIRYHLENCSEGRESIAEKLQSSLYIDNCVTSIDDVTELEGFIVNSTKIFAEAQMDLRMWEFGPVNQVSFDPRIVELSSEKDFATPVSVLGLQWDRESDSLIISAKFELKTNSPTKREVLSVIQSIFDPIGFLCPVLLPAKLLLQETWITKTPWDAPLPENIRNKFLAWYRDLSLLSELKLPRRVGYGSKEYWSLHICCDASQFAYASVIFLRCSDEERVSVQLIAAKSRLAPVKKVTIPRLELLACVIGARLCKYVSEALNLSNVRKYFWSDSSTALAWIRSNDQWGTFVGNRVREICQLSDPKQWSYIPGPLNPADLPSRGCSPRQLLSTRWYEGPEWLKSPNYSDKSPEPLPCEELVNIEKKKGLSRSLTVKVESPRWFERISKFSRIVRVLAWVLRFLGNARKKSISKEKILTVAERQKAENILFRTVQQECFPEAKEVVKGLMTIRDEDGLIRVKSKIIDRDDEFAFRFPLLLPSKHYLVNCLIRDFHENNCHAGLQVLAAKLRENYWIISVKRAIRNVVTKCVICRRFTSKPPVTAPIHLPIDRVRDAAIFEVTGIDLCGPLFLKTKKKIWIVLFTCAIYRAIHLELVTSLSTETFIQALRRFIARRGRPSIVHTDNGTNFTGTNNLLKELNWEEIQAAPNLFPIRWKFIPPTAAWWGGFWERLIRSVKELLVRVLGRSILNFEELSTVLCDVESTVNSRPLTYISDGPEEFLPLTPAMFLQDIAEVGVPDLDIIDRKKLQLRHQYCQKLREELRSRFRREYLSQLVQKAGNSRGTLKEGDVVLVGLENQKRLKWPMAVVQKTLPSRDGKVRVVQVKTRCGTLIRPIQKLYPLEISDKGDPVFQSKFIETRSRYGRTVKVPERLKL